jgi:hypothetical protein
MAHWMLSADQQLVNLDVVEVLEVLDSFSDEVTPADVEAGRAKPIYTELIARLPSGDEVVMFDDEDAEVVVHAFELLKVHLAAGPSHDLLRGVGIVSLQELVDRAGAQKN